MQYQTYILTLAADNAEAIANANGCVDDNVGTGLWFDYGSVDGGRETVELSKVRKELQGAIEHCETELRKALELFDKYRMKDGVRGSMGYQASIIAAICQQEFKDPMPFWNMETNDWDLPGGDGFEDEHGRRWYAVPVALHF